MANFNEADTSEQYKILLSAKNWWKSKSRTKEWDELNIPQKQKVVKMYYNIIQHPTWESLTNEYAPDISSGGEIPEIGDEGWRCSICGGHGNYQWAVWHNSNIDDIHSKYSNESSLFLNSVCKNCGKSDFESVEDDGIIKKVRCKNCFNTIYGGEAFDEQEHPRDNDGKFAPKGGGSKQKDSQRITGKLSSTYSNLQPEFIHAQIRKAEALRENARTSNQTIQNDLRQLQGAMISGRIKEVESMVGKIGRKPDEYRDVSDLNDVSGVRVMTKNIGDVSNAINYIRSKYNIVEEKNNIDQDRGGYRSYHVIVQDNNGVKSEIQIRTENQDAWANWCHDNFYKPKNQKLREFYNANKEIITNYSLGMSNYYYQKDIGIDAQRPECPPEIEQMVGCMS